MEHVLCCGWLFWRNRANPVSAATITYETSRSFLSFTTGTTTQLAEQTFDTNGLPVFSNIGSPQSSYNAVGYNALDGYLYGITNSAPQSLIRIHHDGSIEQIATLASIGFGFNDSTYEFWQSGVIDNNGKYYVGYSNAAANHIYVIDLSVLPATPTSTMVSLSDSTVRIGDYVYIDGNLWGIQNDGIAVRINPNSGVTTKFTQSVVPAATTAWMGMWTYGDDSIGIIERDTGQYVRFKIENSTTGTPTFKEIAKAVGQTAPNGDAASCISHSVDLGIKAEAPAVVLPATTFPIKYTVTNHGESDTSGYVVSQTLPDEFSNYQTTTPGCSISGNKLQCILGKLYIGDSFEINLTAVSSPIDKVCAYNGALVTANEKDINEANNFDRAQTCVKADSTPTDPTDPTDPGNNPSDKPSTGEIVPPNTGFDGSL